MSHHTKPRRPHPIYQAPEPPTRVERRRDLALGVVAAGFTAALFVWPLYGWLC